MRRWSRDRRATAGSRQRIAGAASFIWAMVAMCLTGTTIGNGDSRSPAQSLTRTIVVIGDLHMGPGTGPGGQGGGQGAGQRVGQGAGQRVGRQAAGTRTAGTSQTERARKEVGAAGGRWHPFEDFRWHDEFVAFLNAIDAEGGGATDLVLNGDTFELRQAHTVTCGHDDPRLGCTEADALARMETVIAAHAGELRALGDFARSGSNRVHVIPGDHDAALLFPVVRARALQAFGAPEGRVQIVESDGWLSPDERVYVEHGHQLPLGADRFTNWPRPFLSAGVRDHLERPWGEQVIQPVFDRTEPRYPIVDNVAELGAGAKYAIAADEGDPPEGVPALLRYFLTKTTWQQFRMDLDDGEVQAPEWDLAAIRRDPGAFLASSLPADDPFAPKVAKAAAAGELRALDPGVTDATIVAICDYRAAIRRARRRMERVLTQLAGVGAPMLECPRTSDTVGSAFEHYWRSRNESFGWHIDAVREQLARASPGLVSRAIQPFDVFVYGHTHLADRPFRPRGEAGPLVVTSGAWQRTITPVQLEQLAKERGTTVGALLGELQPEDLPPCYSFLQVAGGAAPGGTRTPVMRAWRRGSDSRWGMAASCGG
ncbi:MAG: hypothetical protein ACT4QD_01040 [Acidobacteriota bacterium]